MSRNIPATDYRRQRGYIYNFVLEEVRTVPPPPSPPDPKKAIRFDYIKRDEDIVYESNYKFNTDIEILITSSKKTRAAKNNEKKAPRRQNPWILYRRDKCMSPEFEGLKSSVVSMKIREMWRNESQDIKKLFTALSGMAEKKHIEEYGMNYKYKPNNNLRRKKKAVQAVPSKVVQPKNERFELTINKGFKTLDFSSIDSQETVSPPPDSIPPSPHNMSPLDNFSPLSDSTSSSNNISLPSDTTSPPSENILPSPIDISIYNSSPVKIDDIWHDPICDQFALNNEYTYNIDDDENINEIDESTEEPLYESFIEPTYYDTLI